MAEEGDLDKRQAEGGQTEDVIDLGNLVKLSEQPNSLSDEEFDSLLQVEAPELAQEMMVLREAVNAAQISETRSIEEEREAFSEDTVSENAAQLGKFRKVSVFFRLKQKALFSWGKVFFSRLIRDTKGLIFETVISLKERFKLYVQQLSHHLQLLSQQWRKWLLTRTVGQKFLAVFTIVVATVLVGTVYRLFQGALLPPMKKEFISSFSEVADAVFKISPNENYENFNDPILHPEFIFSLDRIVVNLLKSENASSHSNPMAAFDLYLQADSRQGVMELKGRSVEIRDQVSRAVEQITYPEFVTEEGKIHVKLILRQEINRLLNQGRVRRVYFKTLVLNPET